MSKAQKIVGFGNSREKNDFYATPEDSTESLMKVTQFRGDIYEPCCGQGHISKVLINKVMEAHKVVSLLYKPTLIEKKL